MVLAFSRAPDAVATNLTAELVSAALLTLSAGQRGREVKRCYSILMYTAF